MDVVAFGPSAAGPGQLQRRSGSREIVLFQGTEDFLGFWVLIERGVAGQPNAPILVAVPPVVKHVGLGTYVGIDGLIEVVVKGGPLFGRPPFVAEVVSDRTASQIVGERNVAFLDRAAYYLHCHFDRFPTQRLISLDRRDQRQRDHLRVLIGLLLPGNAGHAFVGIGALPGKPLQALTRTEQPGVSRRHGMSSEPGGCRNGARCGRSAPIGRWRCFPCVRRFAPNCSSRRGGPGLGGPRPAFADQRSRQDHAFLPIAACSFHSVLPSHVG